MGGQRIVTLATCNLGQWAMDFEGNMKRVIESIKKAREAGASYRVHQCFEDDTVSLIHPPVIHVPCHQSLIYYPV